MPFDQEKFDQLYKEVRSLFPLDTDDPRFQYVRAGWIFPNHLDLVIDFARQLAKKYEASEEVAALGALLHDVGLVYKRESADSAGHEDRSIEYAMDILQKHGYSQDIIDAVRLCILATEPATINTTLEQDIVRTADGLAHILSVHYYAKANFSPDWESAFKFISNKIEKDWNKIVFEDEKTLIRPVYEYIKMVASQHASGGKIDLSQLPWMHS
jgi:HD superfamily phosphodiesterase